MPLKQIKCDFDEKKLSGFGRIRTFCIKMFKRKLAILFQEEEEDFHGFTEREIKVSKKELKSRKEKLQKAIKKVCNSKGRLGKRPLKVAPS